MSAATKSYLVTVHVGPLRKTQADEVLERVRAYQGEIPAGSFMVGTESLYFRVNDQVDAVGARVTAEDFLLAVFGRGSGLWRGITRCVDAHADALDGA